MKRLNLKFFRQRLDLTQEEMAEKLGIAKVTYVNIELGNANPSFGVLEKFAEVFEVDDVWEIFKKC